MCHGGTRECPILLGFGFRCVGTTHILSLGVSFAFGTDFIKMKSIFVRTCALLRKPKSPFLTECLLVSSRQHEIVLILFEKLSLFVEF